MATLTVPVPQAPTPQECGAQLINAKNDLHVQWSTLQRDAKAVNGRRLLPRKTLDALRSTGSQALETAKACQVHPGVTGKIVVDMDELEATVRFNELTRETPMAFRVPSHYIFDADTASKLLTDTVNRLANDVHNAGYSLLEKLDRRDFAGCRIFTEDLRTIDAGTLTYCEGSATPTGNGTSAAIVPDGHGGLQVEQSLGVHRAVWRFKETERPDVFQIEGEYTETRGDCGHEYRGASITRVLEGLGLTVDQNGTSYTIQGEIVGKENVRALAYFMASLWGVAISCDEYCISETVGDAWDVAVEQAAAKGENLWEGRAYEARDEHECSEGERYSSSSEYSESSESLSSSEQLRAKADELRDDWSSARHRLVQSFEEPLALSPEGEVAVKDLGTRVGVLQDIIDEWRGEFRVSDSSFTEGKALRAQADQWEEDLKPLKAQATQKINDWFTRANYPQYLRDGHAEWNLCGQYADYLKSQGMGDDEADNEAIRCHNLWFARARRGAMDQDVAQYGGWVEKARKLLESNLEGANWMEWEFPFYCPDALNVQFPLEQVNRLDLLCEQQENLGMVEDVGACRGATADARIALAGLVIQGLEVCTEPLLEISKIKDFPKFYQQKIEQSCAFLGASEDREVQKIAQDCQKLLANIASNQVALQEELDERDRQRMERNRVEDEEIRRRFI